MASSKGYDSAAQQRDIVSIRALGAPVSGAATAAFIAAVASSAAIIYMPACGAGLAPLTIATPITINREVRFEGAGSCGAQSGSAGGQPDPATTYLSYTGVGDAFPVVGSGGEGVENVHFSNFSLWGNALADGGINLGTGTNVTKGSIRNVHIRGFTNAGANLGYGVRVGNCLSYVFEGVYTQSNHDGWNVIGTSTTLSWIQCYSRTNTRYGWLVQQSLGSSWFQCFSESNGSSGLCINAKNGNVVSNCNFYAFYTEGNNLTVVGPVIDVTRTGTGSAISIHFWGGIINEALDGAHSTPLIRLGTCADINFYNMGVTTTGGGFMTCSAANTSACTFVHRSANVAHANVTNNTQDTATGLWNVELRTSQGTPPGGHWVPVGVAGGITFTGTPTGEWRCVGDLIFFWGSGVTTRVQAVTFLGIEIQGLPVAAAAADRGASANLEGTDATHYQLGSGIVAGNSMFITWNTDTGIIAGTTVTFSGFYRSPL